MRTHHHSSLAWCWRSWATRRSEAGQSRPRAQVAAQKYHTQRGGPTFDRLQWDQRGDNIPSAPRAWIAANPPTSKYARARGCMGIVDVGRAAPNRVSKRSMRTLPVPQAADMAVEPLTCNSASCQPADSFRGHIPDVHQQQARLPHAAQTRELFRSCHLEPPPPNWQPPRVVWSLPASTMWVTYPAAAATQAPHNTHICATPNELRHKVDICRLGSNHEWTPPAVLEWKEGMRQDSATIPDARRTARALTSAPASSRTSTTSPPSSSSQAAISGVIPSDYANYHEAMQAITMRPQCASGGPPRTYVIHIIRISTRN